MKPGRSGSRIVSSGGTRDSVNGSPFYAANSNSLGVEPGDSILSRAGWDGRRPDKEVFYQIRHTLSLSFTMGWPGLQEKASANSCMFTTTPLMRNLAGE